MWKYPLHCFSHRCFAVARALVELALRDVDRFQRQKVKDLKDVFTNYAVLQTEKYKKVFL